MTRILFLVSHPIGAWKNGADLAALQLATQLAAGGDQVGFAAVLLAAEPALSTWRARLARGELGVDAATLDLAVIDLPPPSHPRAVAPELAAATATAVARVIARAAPDVVIVPWGTVALARHARATHPRVVLLVQNGAAAGRLAAAEVHGLALATVSPDVAERLAARLGRPAQVILNPIAAPPRVDGPPGARVGMVNFCAEKGALVFLNVAANLPATEFVATGGWAGRAADYPRMTTGLPNLTIVPATDDMAGFYRDLAMLLVPSLVDEAFARVVIEAQLAGVPVVCTSRCPARRWSGGLVVDAPPRDDEGSDDDLHDAERHAPVIRGFLDAVVTLADPANHAIAVASARAAGAAYLDAQRRSFAEFVAWLAAP